MKPGKHLLLPVFICWPPARRGRTIAALREMRCPARLTEPTTRRTMAARACRTMHPSRWKPRPPTATATRSTRPGPIQRSRGHHVRQQRGRHPAHELGPDGQLRQSDGHHHGPERGRHQPAGHPRTRHGEQEGDHQRGPGHGRPRSSAAPGYGGGEHIITFNGSSEIRTQGDGSFNGGHAVYAGVDAGCGAGLFQCKSMGAAEVRLLGGANDVHQIATTGNQANAVYAAGRGFIQAGNLDIETRARAHRHQRGGCRVFTTTGSPTSADRTTQAASS